MHLQEVAESALPGSVRDGVRGGGSWRLEEGEGEVLGHQQEEVEVEAEGRLQEVAEEGVPVMEEENQGLVACSRSRRGRW